MPAIRQTETLVAHRKIGDRLVSEGHLQARPVVERRIDDLVRRESAGGVGDRHVADLPAPPLDQRHRQRFGRERAALAASSRTRQHRQLFLHEVDRALAVPKVQVNTIPSGLYDSAPVNYYGTVAWHGYALQPAAQIIRLQDAQSGFKVSGTGIVAVIDTGVDTTHPVLVPVLLPGYDFTRNQPGASEWLDVPELNGTTDSAQDEQPAFVQQSSVAVLDQSSVAVLDGPPYGAFGHGTMTSGLVHLVAPKAKILPLKAFTSDGTGQLSNIIKALYYAVQNHANVVNMSFDLSSSSPALNQAISSANKAGVVLVAAAGNESTSAPVYPAALNSMVLGIASTSNSDTLSSFSNYGSTDVWIAAPGENVISTYPGGTYASASGTSFSSPLTAGAADLLLSAKSATLNQSQAAAALSHARTLTPNLNHGRLDIYQAVAAWLNGSGSTSSSGTCLLLCL